MSWSHGEGMDIYIYIYDEFVSEQKPCFMFVAAIAIYYEFETFTKYLFNLYVNNT